MNWQTTTTNTTIRRENGAWVLRIVPPEGTPQEFTCASEEMARKLETVFAREDKGRRRQAS